VSTHALLHPRYRLHAVHNERVVCEDAVVVPTFDRRGHTGRPIVTLLLDGAARISAHGRHAWLDPNDVLAMDEKARIVMRQEGERYAALAFEWEPELLRGRPEPFGRGRVGGETRAALVDVFERVARGEGTPGDVVRVVEALREAGLDLRLPAEAECDEQVPAETADLSGVLDRLLSRLDEQPMVADLERTLGVSSRQVNRRVAAFNTRYGFNAAGWRDARNRRRLFVGIALMTAPGATGETVARAVGYRALSAFTHALRDAGLPPPSAIPGVVASLRRRD
jgi:hypothetical protein